MSRHFSVDGAEDRILSVLSAKAEFEKMGMPLSKALEFNHVVMQWVLGQEGLVTKACMINVRSATKGNISNLDGLWELCAKHGIVLSEEEKISLYQDFLDD
jgi:hypothetical protein